MKSFKGAMAKILLVDDKKDVCDFIARFFGERNFEVSCAMSGGDALLFIKKDHPDIILLDVKMRDINGIEILKRIKNVNRGAPVVIISCVDDMDTMSKAKRLGAAAYLTKPLVLRELLEVVMENVVSQNKLFSFKRIPKNNV